MKLLITGGAGFIGSNFIHYWLKNHPQDDIINFDNLTYAGNLENLKGVEANPHYRFIKGDICQSNQVEQAIHGTDIIVHFAAESHVDRSILGPQPFILTNVLGTQMLLEMAKVNKVKRFHHISTDEVFGSLELEDNRKFNEMTNYDPHSPYAASKAAADHVVRAYFHTYGLPITITNCSNNYGPYQHPEKLIPLTITNIIEGKKIPVYGDGLYVRDWLYVEDHCRAIEAVLLKGNEGGTYCVGGLTEELSNIQIVKKILKLMGRDESEIDFVKDRPGHDRRYAIEWSRIKSELGWSPQYDFDTYLHRTIDWYKTHTDWWKHVKSGEYLDYYKKQYSK